MNETVLFAFPLSEIHDPKIDSNEVTLINNQWDLIQNIYNARRRLIGMNILYSYSNIMMEKFNRKIPIKMDDKNYRFIYFPLSEDNNLHYQMSIRGDKCEIGLHFEGNYEKYYHIAENIVHNSKINIPLKIKETYPKGCIYYVDNPFDNKLCTNLMIYLIQITLPELFEQQLIAKDLFFTWQDIQYSLYDKYSTKWLSLNGTGSI